MVTRKHLGKRVVDTTGREGILRDVMTDWEDPSSLPQDRRKQKVAFLCPTEGGGREWMVPPEEVNPL